MNYITIQNLILAQLGDLGTALFVILVTGSGISLAYLIFRFGVNAIWHSDGTSNWLGTKWSAWDKLTYSPWKGYNRLRSRRWNMEHMN